MGAPVSTQAESVKAGDTKERILDSAEKLFADAGFDGTSLRSITARAGVNLAAVHYYFGSKEALLQAVLARRLEPINRRRIELLDRLEGNSGEQPPGMEVVLRAFMEPPLREIRRLGETGEQFVRLASRAHSEPNPQARAVFLPLFQEVVQRFMAAFRRARPDMDDGELHWKFHFLVGSMAHLLSWGGHEECAAMLSRDTPVVADPDEILEAMVAFCAAGMSAPVPQGEEGAAR
jgi:AcrR family transcriptional regulator